MQERNLFVVRTLFRAADDAVSQAGEPVDFPPDVIHRKRQVMQAFAALGDVLADGALRRSAGQQFHFALARLKKTDIDPLGRNMLSLER